MYELANRRSQTEQRIILLRERLEPAEKYSAGKACVYVTGSFGRREASKGSDLDLFIVGKSDGTETPDGMQGSLLNHLDEICIKADLIEATRALGFPDFSGDGRYLVHYSVRDFTKTLGTREDDVTNTFTARLLLLLESYPLLENLVYHDVIKEVIAAYWRDYGDHKTDFMPAFLANDILRLWRTFCVNYEAGSARQPDEKKAKGKLKNYKLKHSRLLTCYSAILYLLTIYRLKKSVAPTDALEMSKLTPTQRLEWLTEQPELADSHSVIVDLLQQYDLFLQKTNTGESVLIDRFMDKKQSIQYMDDAYRFGDLMFDALSAIGNGNRFHRLLVV